MAIYPTTAILMLFLMLQIAAVGNAATAIEHIKVDVFTVSTQAAMVIPEDSDSVSVAIHKLDGIARFNSKLSTGLTRDPELAKQQVLRRFKSFDKSQQIDLQHSAEALALALQLGVHRYPAIVLNSQWVIYGVLDVQAAIDLFRAWRKGATQ